MAGEPRVPTFTDAQVIACLRAAAKRGLTHTRKGGADLLSYGYDMEGVNELIAGCTEDEIDKHQLTENYPDHNDYIVVLKVDLEDQKRPFYVKVALALPNLASGELLSFHEWGQYR